MWLSKNLCLLLCYMFWLPLKSCKGQGNGFDFSNNRLLIASNGDKSSTELADYFYQHLNKRINKQSEFSLKRTDDLQKLEPENILYFELVPDLEADYEIINESGKLSVFGKTKATMRWLSYALISRFGDFIP